MLEARIASLLGIIESFVERRQGQPLSEGTVEQMEALSK